MKFDPSKERDALAIIDEAVRLHNPSSAWSGFSGGTDSLATALVFSKHSAFSGCFHIDTGIGLPECRRFVEETCTAHGWPLETRVTPPSIYEWFVGKFGFPGPPMHSFVYRWLKDRRIMDLLREKKQHRRDRVMLVTGVRAQESERRMGTVEKITRDGCLVWCAPLINWSKTDVMLYLDENNADPSIVSQLLHMSGECLCGSFAKPGERQEIALWFPEMVSRLAAIEEIARSAGKPCVWGARPKRTTKRQSKSQRMAMMCQTCLFRFEDEE